MKFRITLIIFILLAVSIMTIGCDAIVVSLEVSETEYDYGTINIGESRSHIFRVTNPSNDNILISNLSFLGLASNDFTLTSGQRTPIILSPGRYIGFVIDFKPTQEGFRNSVFVIKHSGKAKNSTINLIGTGFGIPKIELLETSSG